VGFSGKTQISQRKNPEKTRKAQMNLTAVSADHYFDVFKVYKNAVFNFKSLSDFDFLSVQCVLSRMTF